MLRQVITQVIRGHLGTLTQYNDSTYNLTQALIGQAKHSHFVYIRMLINGGLNFDATDVFTTTDDDFLNTVHNIDKTVLIHISHVTRMKPAINEGLSRGLRFVPVTQHIARGLDAQLTALTQSQLSPILCLNTKIRDSRHHAARTLGVGQIEGASVDRAQGIGLGQAVTNTGRGFLECTGDFFHLVGRPGRTAGHDFRQ